MILSQPLHQYQDGDTHIAAAIDNGNLVIAATRNDEAASEGNYGQLITVIGLQDAIAIAKAVLASQAQEIADEDAAYEAWLAAETADLEEGIAEQAYLQSWH